MISIIFFEDEPEKKSIVKEIDFNNHFFIKDNILYENYGTELLPLWMPNFDSEYRIVYD